MVIPERVTPSGMVLADIKLHCGLGFDKMFDCFIYEGLDKKATKEKYFKVPKKVSDNHMVIVDEIITDKFRLDMIEVDDEYTYHMHSYGIMVVTQGSGTVSGVKMSTGDRAFIPASEGVLKIAGKMKALICMP